MFLKKIKCIIFIFSVLLLAISLKIVFCSDKIVFSNQKYRENLVLNISIDNQLCSYDKKNDIFFYSTNENNYKKWNIKLYSLYKLRYDIEKIDDNNYLIKAFNNDYYQNVNLTITSLPVIDLQNLDLNFILTSYTYPKYDKNIFSSSFKDEFNFDNVEYFARFDENDKKTSKYEKIYLKVRGASSILYPKKAYKIQFDKNVDIFDLPKDDKYVLDALYVDKSKIRNLLSSNIWNMINNNQSINNDLNGRFVELFINNEYNGLYIIKEKVDKSVTNITDSGLILKSSNHMYQYYIDELLDTNNDFSSINDVFLNFEIKKYNSKSFISFVNKFRNYYSDISYETLYSNYELDNYINYIVLISLIGGFDNINYNYYLSLQDNNSKILITPWDMDLTFGLNTWNIYWNDNIFENFINMESSSDIEWMNENITKETDEKTLDLLKKRYFELRKKTITTDNINNYIDSYKDILVNSGAAKRDSERWYEYDVEFEIEQIREWTKKRIEFLDEYFNNI